MVVALLHSRVYVKMHVQVHFTVVSQQYCYKTVFSCCGENWVSYIFLLLSSSFQCTPIDMVYKKVYYTLWDIVWPWPIFTFFAKFSLNLLKFYMIIADFHWFSLFFVIRLHFVPIVDFTLNLCFGFCFRVMLLQYTQKGLSRTFLEFWKLLELR